MKIPCKLCDKLKDENEVMVVFTPLGHTEKRVRFHPCHDCKLKRRWGYYANRRKKVS